MCPSAHYLSPHLKPPAAAHSHYTLERTVCHGVSVCLQLYSVDSSMACLHAASHQHVIPCWHLCCPAGVACQHGRLAPEGKSGSARRFAVPPETWALLAQYWPRQVLLDIQARKDKAARAAAKRAAGGGAEAAAAAAVADAAKGEWVGWCWAVSLVVMGSAVHAGRLVCYVRACCL